MFCLTRPEYWSHSPSPGNFLNPGIEPRSPALQEDSLPAELPGKPQSTGVGSLSLLHRIFLTQELNRVLLHCRRILYQGSSRLSLSLAYMLESQVASVVFDCVILWTVACQAALSMGFSRQKYWSGLPYPLPGHLPKPGIEPVLLPSPAQAGRLFNHSAPGKPAKLSLNQPKHAMLRLRASDQATLLATLAPEAVSPSSSTQVATLSGVPGLLLPACYNNANILRFH